MQVDEPEQHQAIQIRTMWTDVPVKGYSESLARGSCHGYNPPEDQVTHHLCSLLRPLYPVSLFKAPVVE